jgi:predicted TIM-barrel fold metal-dependent hydrolase
VNGPIIDVNVNLSRWPCRHLREDRVENLLAKLQSQGVVEAWAGSFDGLLHKDLAGVNARLAHACRPHRAVRLVPFGSVNPLLPDWEEDLRRCAVDHRMPGIRVHPNYHGYKLDHPVFAQLLKRAAERGLVVELAVVMEDERMMHPLLRVPPVNLEPLAALVARTPGLRLLLLNALSVLRGEELLTLVRAGEVYIEIAMCEGVGGVANLFHALPLERILFGSHAPLFYLESAVLKLKESALSPAQLRALQEGNARRLLPAGHELQGRR